MGLFKIWKDHVTQFSNRYKEINNADGTITHEAVEGEVIQDGTPQNAKNFNDMEQRILTLKGSFCKHFLNLLYIYLLNRLAPQRLTSYW